MLILWMAIQLLTLALAAGQVPLSARFPEPADRQATAEMLVAQIATASLIFPLLLGDFRSWILTLAGGLPMLTLAWLLGQEPVPNAVSAASYVAVWLLTLTLWRLILTDDLSQPLAVAITTLWTLGGPVLLYLRAEFAGPAGATAPSNSLLWSAAGGPIVAALTRLWGGPPISMSDFPLEIILLLGIIFFFRQRHQSRRLPNKLSTKL
jgi:hypothetical protein